MSRHSLPRAPTALFDLAGQIVDALREKPVPSGLNLKIALELLTKLNSAMDAYLAYLAVREGAKYSTTARVFARSRADLASQREAASAMGPDNRCSRCARRRSLQAGVVTQQSLYCSRCIG